MNLIITLKDESKREFSGISIQRAMNIMQFYKERLKSYNLYGSL